MNEFNLGDTRRLLCRTCRTLTNHAIVFEYHWIEKIEETDDEGYVNVTLLYQCKGCNSVCICLMGCWETDRDQANGDYLFTEEIIPNPSLPRPIIRNARHLSKQISIAYEETRKAINEEMFILAPMGIIAIVEGVCIENGITVGNIKSKIDKLYDQRIITEHGAKMLHIVRVHRNSSAHDLEPMSKRQIVLSMDVIEEILVNIYTLPKEFEDFNTPY